MQPETMTEADVEELKKDKENLMNCASQVFSKMYEQTAGAQGAGPDMAGAQGAGPDVNPQTNDASGNGKDDDVIDGDFREL